MSVVRGCDEAVDIREGSLVYMGGTEYGVGIVIRMYPGKSFGIYWSMMGSDVSYYDWARWAGFFRFKVMVL